MRPMAMEGAPLQFPIEGELRAWRAGCSFWGAAHGVTGQAPNDAREVECLANFPATYYCHLNLSVEFVVLIGRRLKGLGRTLEQVGRGEHALEQTMSSYCVEAERAENGNPLSLDNFHAQWSLAQCVERARDTVLAPSWRSTLELCPAAEKSGPDARQAAAELEGWR
jgi:hypothetical protein